MLHNLHYVIVCSVRFNGTGQIIKSLYTKRCLTAAAAAVKDANQHLSFPG